MTKLLTFTDRGIYCPSGDFYIDPWRPVDRALITHAHADHARPGMQHYLATELTAAVMRHRLGDVTTQTIALGERLRIGSVVVSFHPAGHVPGSAQIRVEKGGETWVVSGDYKTVPDGLAAPFEPVPCHAFITECTFGLPVFAWQPQAQVVDDLNAWWAANKTAGRTSIIGAYAFGKAQRIIASVDPTIGPILTHGAVEYTNQVLRTSGLDLPPTRHVTPDLDTRAQAGALIVAPPAALRGNWIRRFGPASTAYASGWMALRGIRRRRAADRGFIMSDHADWHGLNAAIKATGAERVFVTHGYTAVFRRWLEEQGYHAEIVDTEFEGENLDTPDQAEADRNGNTAAGQPGLDDQSPET